MTQYAHTQPHRFKLALPQHWLGGVFAVLTVLIWSGYFLSLRAGVLSPLPTHELSLIRFSLPGLILLPVFLSSWSAFRGQPLWVLAAIVCCAGLGFFLITLFAMRETSVLLGSTLAPGAAPLFVSLIAIVFFKEPIQRSRMLGLAMIAVGICVFVAQATLTFNKTTLIGIGLFLFSASVWSVFTIAVRLSTLKPIQIASLVTVPNGLLVLIWVLFRAEGIDFSGVGFSALVIQVLVQGLLVGIFSGVVYSAAIARLGAEKTSAIGSATPAVASIAAVFLFNEPITWLSGFGVAMVMLGVIVTSRIR